MVPTWTLAIAAVLGVVAGLLVGRLTARPSSSEGSGQMATPTTEAGQEPAASAQEVAAEQVPARAGETPRIDMEDVVSELERRYQGRRAEEEKERARRKAEREGPTKP